MTKPDYERLAKALRALRMGNSLDDLSTDAYNNAVDQIALACQDLAAVPFSYSRFRDACYKDLDK